MEFNLSTFLIEIANFLILIWILQRLFYKPLLAMIAQRKQHIDQTLADAQAVRQKAEAECTLYALPASPSRRGSIRFRNRWSAERCLGRG